MTELMPLWHQGRKATARARTDEHSHAGHATPELGGSAQAARSERPLLEHARHALLPGRGLRPFLERGICAPLCGAARQDARARARLRDRARRPQPLELWRGHAVATRALGVARDLVLCRGAARRRAPP